MYYYNLNGKILVSNEAYPKFDETDENRASESKDTIYVLNRLDPSKSRRSFCISHPSLMFIQKEDVELLQMKDSPLNLPPWILHKIAARKVMSVNTTYPGWEKALCFSLPGKWKINIVGLGDVGGMLSVGLRLLGGGTISRIGLYDRDKNRIKRWYLECSQILSPEISEIYPEMVMLEEDNIFDCNMLVFCVSCGVPEIGSNVKDVRMAQFKGNSDIIGSYARLARKAHFKGIFAVVSDPVDLLCRVVLDESNKNEDGTYDLMGLSPEQIRGYGLGVMNARAAFYASQSPESSHYLKEGRAFGPHGNGLVIADSIENYNDEISLYLTEKAKSANMDVRSTGYKPYIAPALSSGSLSIIATITGKWHYSATYMGGIFMGARNRLTCSGTEIEMLDIPDMLWKRIRNAYESLGGAL